MNARQELESIRHLLELGYEDPRDQAAREEAERQQIAAKCARAEALLADSRLDEAISMLESLDEKALDSAAPHHLLAQAYLKRARYQEAAVQLEWLTFHGFENPQLALLGAAVELGRRQYAAAVDQGDYAICIGGDVGRANLIIGEAHLRCGRTDAAETAYRRALDERPEEPAALAGMAAVVLRSGDCESAADWALQALEKNMRMPAAHYLLGVALMRLGRAEQAVTAFEAAASINPRLVAPLRWLERISRDRLGDMVRAASYRKEAFERLHRRRAIPSRGKATAQVTSTASSMPSCAI